MPEDARVDLFKLMHPKHLGHSSKEIGDKIGVSASTVENWRSYTRCPNMWALIKIRDAYPFEFSIEKEADRAKPILERKKGIK